MAVASAIAVPGGTPPSDDMQSPPAGGNGCAASANAPAVPAAPAASLAPAAARPISDPLEARNRFETLPLMPRLPNDRRAGATRRRA
ncbi:hypothetical protein GTC050_24530 [Burkholderia pseudomallei]|nr:hypothetical protein GTC050_24530 [Burkholderia pseudomallei]BEH31220.1 hypothetical protein GTC054_24360 [Burkholderia pseudomallei]